MRNTYVPLKYSSLQLYMCLFFPLECEFFFEGSWVSCPFVAQYYYDAWHDQVIEMTVRMNEHKMIEQSPFCWAHLDTKLSITNKEYIQ